MPSELILTQDGSNPPAPNTNEVTLFAKSGNIYAINNAGAVQDFSVVNDLMMFEYRVASGTQGGAATAGSWQTRPINTDALDTSNIASLNLTTSEITLPAGSYEFHIVTSHHSTGRTATRLYNATTSQVIQRSASVLLQYVASTVIANGQIVLQGYFTLTASSLIRVEQRVETTQSANSNGMGGSTNFGDQEVYLHAMFRRYSL